MKHKPKSIVEELGFGKYYPLSIYEIYTGTKNFPKVYLDNFIKNIQRYLINDESVINSVYGIDNTSEAPIKVYKSFILYNYNTGDTREEDYTFDNLKHYLDKIFTIEVPLAAIAFQQPDLIDLELWANTPVYKNERYMIEEGNPGYIHWLLEEHKQVFINPKLIPFLENEEINYYHGKELIKLVNGIAQFKPKFSTYKRKFPQKAIIANEEKYNSWLSTLSESKSDVYDEQIDKTYSKYGGPIDGYGGNLDDDFIDDALDGEPDAYWNLD